MWAHAAMTAPPAPLQAVLVGPAPFRPAPSLPWSALIPGAPLLVTSAEAAAAARKLTGSRFPLSPPNLDLTGSRFPLSPPNLDLGQTSNSFIAETINCRDLSWSDHWYLVSIASQDRREASKLRPARARVAGPALSVLSSRSECSAKGGLTQVLPPPPLVLPLLLPPPQPAPQLGRLLRRLHPSPTCRRIISNFRRTARTRPQQQEQDACQVR